MIGLKESNIISYFDIDDFESVIKQIKDMGYKIYYIDGKRTNTIEKLFIWIKDTFPLDPPLSGKVNLDAFVDSFWGGLYEQKYEKVSIVWRYPNELVKQDENMFYKLLECIKDIAKGITSGEYGVDKSVILKTLLFDSGTMPSKLMDSIKDVENKLNIKI